MEKNINKKNNSTFNIIMAIIAAAAICLLFFILCIYLSGTRFISLKTDDGGTVKYFGKVDSNDQLTDGKVYF